MDDAARVRKLLRQQAAIASFGSFAFYQDDLLKVLTEAARVCARGFGVPFCNVCRYRAVEKDFIIEAGYGWADGVVGQIVLRADESTPQGRAFVTGEPSICEDLRGDNLMAPPPMYAAHGIVSTIDVIIKGKDQPYGVLEIDSDRQHDYDEHDIEFLTGLANVLAEAVAASARASVLETTIEQMNFLIQEKGQLQDQKNLLSKDKILLNDQKKILLEENDHLENQKKALLDELQHRVRNNLQLVYGMLCKQLGAAEAENKIGKRSIEAIARRIFTLAQVYDHLLGVELTQTIDFGGYVKSLCRHLAEAEQATDGVVTITCDSDAFVLDLDVTTALGMVVGELVANSYGHAFQGGRGAIIVSVRCAARKGEMAVLTVGDDGTGFRTEAGGTGRGLDLVQRLTKQVNGTATVDADHGTVWTIRFPMAFDAAPVATGS